METMCMQESDLILWQEQDEKYQQTLASPSKLIGNISEEASCP